MLDRAYFALEVKSFDVEARVIEGVATTPDPDQRGDIVEPSGAVFALPLPLLWQHDQTAPVGEVFEARVTSAGILIKARFAQVTEPGALRDQLDKAWQSVKAKLVRGLSIGFKPIEAVPRNAKDPFGGYHIKRWQWAELSAVTLAMNLAATITNIKSAALGQNLPGASGPASRTIPMTYSEQIASKESTRQTALASMADLMAKAEADGGTLDANASATYDSHAATVKALDLHIGRLRELDALNITRATPIVAPARPFVQVKSNALPGAAFVRYTCANLLFKGNPTDAARYAERWNDSTPEVALALKAAVAPGTVTDATWAAPLVNQNISSDFIALLRAATILGKIPGLRKTPFNTKVPAQSASGSYGWVGESKPKPVTKLAFTSETLGITKVAGIVVLTQELLRLSNPDAEQLVRDDMIAGIAAFLDAQFIDPAVAAVAGVNPASITNGAATAAATTNPLADIMGLINHFTTNNIAVDGLAFIMSPSNALSLSFRSNLDGSPQFPGVTTSGGTYRGLTFVTSNTAGTNVIALQPQMILYADDGAVTIDASTEASLQMDSAPASPADATTVYVSLFQTNTVALRAERFANWKRVGASVKYLTAAAYPAPSGTVFDEPPATGRAKG